MKSSLLGQKIEILERSLELHRKLFYLNKFGKWQILRKILIWWKQFLGQTSEKGQINKNGFPPQNEPYTAKISFWGNLKQFDEIDWKKPFWVKN